MSRFADRFRQGVQPLLAVILGLSAGIMVTLVAGENPVFVAQVLFKSAFGSWYDFGMTLFYATPLIFTGLSVAVAFHAGMFNIGAEGQLIIGAVAAAATGMLFPHVPYPIAPVLGALIGFLAGGAWGFIPGYLRAKRNSHEVINTIMLNFIAAGIVSYLIIYPLDNPESQNPESQPVGPGYLLSHWTSLFGDAPVSIAFVIALLTAGAVGFLLWRTVWGYELRAVGENESAARAAGIETTRVRMTAMALAGGIAGLVAIGEIFGNAGKFRLGFSPDYGFIGIAVALLGRNRPLGVVLSALLFGALHKGASDLDLETENVTRELSLVLQALVILSVSADGLWGWLKSKKGASRVGS